MKHIISFLLSSFFLYSSAFAQSVSTNKAFLVGTTNNALPPNETNFFNANIGLFEAALAYGGVPASNLTGTLAPAALPAAVLTNNQAVAATFDANVTSSNANHVFLGPNPGFASEMSASFLRLPLSVPLTGTNYYVDSVAGSDANSGLNWNYPMQSLTNSTITNVGGVNIWIKRGSVFRYQVYFPSGDTVRVYGTGAKPLISGADILTNANFTKTSGWTNTYQIAVPAFSWPNTNPSPSIAGNTNVLMVWENKARLGLPQFESGVTTLLQVDETPGSWLLSNQVLYVNTSDSSNPAANGRLYEASTRTLAVWAGDNVFIEDLQAEEAYALNNNGLQGYQFMADGGGTYHRCEGFRSWNHIMGTADAVVDSVPLVFDSCFAYDGENISAANGGMASFIGFKENFPTGVSNAVIFTNCLAGQPSLYTNASGGTTAFYSHGAPDTNVYTSILNCYFSNMDNGTTLTTKSTTQINGLFGTNMQIGINIASNGLTAVALNHFIFANASQKAIWCQFLTNCNVAILNGTNFNCTNNVWIGDSTSVVGITNVTFAWNGTNNSALGIQSYGGSYNVYSYSNNFQSMGDFFGCYKGDGVQNFLLGSDYNTFGLIFANSVVADANPGNDSSLASWQSASGMDAHSVSTTPPTAYPADFWNVAFFNPAAVTHNFIPNDLMQVNTNGEAIDSGVNGPSVITNNYSGNFSVVGNLYGTAGWNLQSGTPGPYLSFVNFNTDPVALYGQYGWTNYATLGGALTLWGNGQTGNTFASGTNSTQGLLQATNAATGPGLGSNTFVLNGWTFTAVHQDGMDYYTGLTQGVTRWRSTNEFWFVTNLNTISNNAIWAFAVSNLTTTAFPGATSAILDAVIDGECLTNTSPYAIYPLSHWQIALAAGVPTYTSGHDANVAAATGQSASASVVTGGSQFGIDVIGAGAFATPTNMFWRAQVHCFIQ